MIYVPLHAYYRADPAAIALESRLPRPSTESQGGILRDVEPLREAFAIAGDFEVRAYLFGRLAAGCEAVRWAKDLGFESFHPLERSFVFWRGFLDAVAGFRFQRSRAGYEYPQVELRASPAVLRSLLDRLADEVGESGWSDPEGKLLAQSFSSRLDVRGEQAKALVELTHGGVEDSAIDDPSRSEIVARILAWSESSARIESAADGYALARSLSR